MSIVKLKYNDKKNLKPKPFTVAHLAPLMKSKGICFSLKFKNLTTN